MILDETTSALDHESETIVHKNMSAICEGRTVIVIAHRANLHAACAARHELTGPRRLAADAAFLPAALTLQHAPVHPAARRAALAICALFAIVLAWVVGGADVSRVDRSAAQQGRRCS